MLSLISMILVQIQDIVQVEVVKPTLERWARFLYAELRIGDVDKSQSPIEWLGNDNQLVACRDHAQTIAPDILNFLPVSGRYLTIQVYAQAWLTIDEIYVRTKDI